MPLTVQKVKTSKPGKYSDGRGLMLVVKASGARSWVLRYQVNGRRRDMGLGSWPDISLARARDAAAEVRKTIREGGEPLSARNHRSEMRFKDAAEELIAAKKSGWRNAKHAAQWTSSLTTYAYPNLGDLEIQNISTHDVLAVLKPIWTEKTETANRVRQRIEAVIDYGIALGVRTEANPARWRGHLENLLPQPSKVRMVVHHPALPWKDIPTFMTDLACREGVSAQALRFLILTATRSGEVRGATWSEIDIEKRVWTIPAWRMKAQKEHRVPLSKIAVDQLGPPGERTELVFPGAKKSRPMSDMSLSAVVKRMGCRDITVHGFRSTFRDWAGETTSFPREVIEAALAHQLTDKAEAAYARGDLFDKRRKLMNAWARYASGSKRA